MGTRWGLASNGYQNRGKEASGKLCSDSNKVQIRSFWPKGAGSGAGEDIKCVGGNCMTTIIPGPFCHPVWINGHEYF